MTRRLTFAEFRALPEDPAVERELIRGVLHETVRLRTQAASAVSALVSATVGDWSDRRGAGRAFSLPRVNCPGAASSFVPAAAYFDKPSMDRQHDTDVFLTGPPTLAVEIVSPSDRFDRLWAKIDAYLAAGTPWVWIIDPHLRTVSVLRPGRAPALAAGEDELACEPELPGFAAAARSLFPR